MNKENLCSKVLSDRGRSGDQQEAWKIALHNRQEELSFPSSPVFLASITRGARRKQRFYLKIGRVLSENTRGKHGLSSKITSEG